MDTVANVMLLHVFIELVEKLDVDEYATVIKMVSPCQFGLCCIETTTTKNEASVQN